MHGKAYGYSVGTDVNGNTCTYTVETNLNADGSATSEWIKTYSDAVGRTTEVLYADGHYNQSFYNSQGQLSEQIDPDGVVTLYQYNAEGELAYTAIDMNQNGAIDFGGADRITWTTNDVVTDYGVNVRRTRTYLWSQNGVDSPALVSTIETSTDGLSTWQTVYRDANTPVTTQTQTAYYGSGGGRSVTVINPDNSYTINSFSYGRLISSARYDSNGNPIGGTTYGYDAHGRQSTVTDARNGTTVYGYNDADLLNSVTTPSPGTVGGSPQCTVTYYNQMLQATNTLNSDSTSLTSEYNLTGELKRQYGSRTYPVAYSYDYAGRLKTMTNWSSFPSTGARVTTWNYDGYRGWLTNKTYDGPAAGPSYAYTHAGRLQTRTWARSVGGGQPLVTTYSNNNAGDLYTVVYNDGVTPNVTNTYDRLGRLTQQSTLNYQLTSTYNLANELVSESWSGGALNGLSVTNGYDQYLRRTNLTGQYSTTPLLQQSLAYDNASRLQTVSDGNSNSVGYVYLANSRLVSQILFTNGSALRMTTTKQYDYLNRLTSISSINSQPSTIHSHSYAYNSANQRTRAGLADASYWRYEYDALGQVTSGKKYWSDQTPVAGQQFEYAYDDIGNRTQTKAGGDAVGASLRLATHAVNNLNQYTNRTVPGSNDVIGVAIATNAVTVNGVNAYRRGEYFQALSGTNNSAVGQWVGITVSSAGNSNSGHVFIPKTPEQFGYDADGNLTNDGRFSYTWDAENRLTKFESLTSGPAASWRRVTWEYDGKGRRARQTTYDGSGGTYQPTEDLKLLSDGWRNVAELNATNNALVRSYVWGLDLSGSLDGAGGVGGLLMMNSAASGAHCYAYDGNGNVAALVKAADGTNSANYEYGPFGQAIRATGLMAKENPFRFSTKRTDNTSDLVLYEYRFYNPSPGRWLSRDPIGENGGANLYGFLSNDGINKVDEDGLIEFRFVKNARKWNPWPTSGDWSQPAGYGEGSWSEVSDGLYNWIHLWSGPHDGGICNSILGTLTESAGAFNVYAKNECPEKFTIHFAAVVSLNGRGPQNGPSAEFWSYGGQAYSFKQTKDNPPVVKQFDIVVHVQLDRNEKLILRYIPTIAYATTSLTPLKQSETWISGGVQVSQVDEGY